jgi:hypothetical protein
MADFSTEDGGRFENAGKVNTGTTGTTVTASATAHVKGAWTLLLASTAFHSSEIVVGFPEIIDDTNFFMDIGVGAAAAEVVKVPNIFIGAPDTDTGIPSVKVSFDVPAGTRVTARCSAAAASSNIMVSCTLIAKGLMPAAVPARNTSYGASVSTSRGTTMDPGATANTKGAWAVLSASTASPIRTLTLMTMKDIVNATVIARWAVDIGIGAATAEVVAIPDIPWVMTATKIFATCAYCQLPYTIPAGTRLVARAQSNHTTATERILDIAVIGHD